MLSPSSLVLKQNSRIALLGQARRLEPKRWTLADLDSAEPGRLRTSIFEIRCARFRNDVGSISVVLGGYGPGLEDMLASEAVARRALRWQVLHWCAQHRYLLPLGLSGAHREGK